MTQPPDPTVVVPDMCQLHQSLLVHQAGFSRTDPWQALIIVAQVALFHAATEDPTLRPKLGGDLMRIGEIGCLACFKPDVFGGIVVAAQAGGLDAIKRMVEPFLMKGENP